MEEKWKENLILFLDGGKKGQVWPKWLPEHLYGGCFGTFPSSALHCQTWLSFLQSQ